jgi:hypothetical protein
MQGATPVSETAENAALSRSRPLRFATNAEVVLESLTGLGILGHVDAQLNAAVPCPAFRSGVVGYWVGRSGTLDQHLTLIDAAAGQDVAHGLRTVQ